MIKICFVGDWGEQPSKLLERYSAQTPNNDGVWNELVGISDFNKADYIVIMDGAPVNFEIKDWSKIIYLQREPVKDKFWLEHNFPSDIFFDGRYDSFYNVVTWWINIPFNNLVKIPYPDKKKELSTITSGASVLFEHRKRVEFISRISKDIDIDIYGRGIFPYVPKNKYCGALNYNGNCKFLGHYKYNNSLVMENTLLKNSWTEKPADSFLSWCRPIYWGANNFKDYFPEGSYIQLEEDLTKIDVFDFKEKIKEQISLEALKEARNLILYHYQLWPALEKIIKQG